MSTKRPKFHIDGTVTYWSVFHQVWIRDPARLIACRDLATMAAPDRDRVRLLAGPRNDLLP